MYELVIADVKEALFEYSGERVNVYASADIGGGCINHASKLETNIGTFFLKWNARCSEDMFLREAESLSELAKASSGIMKIPKVFCAKKVDQTPGFLVMEYLKTEYATEGSEEKLGQGLAEIHRYKSDTFGFISNNYCGATLQKNNHHSCWPEFFRENRLRYQLQLIQKSRSLSITDIKVFEKLLDRISVLIPDNSVPVLIHGDLWSGNYMFTTQGPALIDPAVYYADREMEFSIITMFGGFTSRFFSAYNEVNPLSSDWRSRNDLYQLYHILNHYLLFGGGYLQQALAVAKRFI